VLPLKDDGATKFRQDVSTAVLPAVMRLYNEALRDIFVGAVVMCGLAFLSTLGMSWNRNLLKKGSGGKSDPERLGDGLEKVEQP
jgi:hypothetical protein